MANFPKMKLTNVGLGLLANVQAGADDLNFTKTVLGDGVTDAPVSSLTALVSPKIEIPIVEGKQVGTSTYQIASFFSNTEITTGFWWREIGVFAKGNDGKEILYCYSNAGDASDYIPVGSDERVEKYIYQSLAIGNAENVTAAINANDSFILKTDRGKANGVAPLGADGKVGAEYLPEMDYVGSEEFKSLSDNFTTHKNASNPHGITKVTIGLGSVPNVATNDQTPTYTEASTLTTLTSGEKLSVALGKIKKAITDLMSHLSNKSNPHGVTASQVGLGNVNNTSDANKPVSTAQATAIADAKSAGTTAQTNINSHTANKSNPHGVTKEQIGLGDVSYGTDKNNDYVRIGKDATIDADLLLKNYYSGVAIGFGSNANTFSVAIGRDSKASGNSCVAIGNQATVDTSMFSAAMAIGNQATAISNGIAIGNQATANNDNALAIGDNAISNVSYGIQLGVGTNNTEGSFQVFGATMLDINNKIPPERLPIYKGSYTGTSKSGESNPNTLTFDFNPKIVIISEEGDSTFIPLVLMQGSTAVYTNSNGTKVTITWGNKRVSWYAKYTGDQFNNAKTYHYVAIG